MQTKSILAVRFTSIDTTTEVAEIAKLGMKAGADVKLEHDVDEYDRPITRATLSRTTPGDVVQDMAVLAYIHGMAYGQTPAAVLDDVRARLENMHVALDVPPSDGPGIAE